jgi:pyrroloquinoline quinone (PQQ) biosynthesis protein C
MSAETPEKLEAGQKSGQIPDSNRQKSPLEITCESTNNGIFFIEAEKTVNEHPVLNHPFLNEFGNLTPAQLKAFIKEQYHLSVTLPQALAATYAHAEDAYIDGEKISAWKIGLPLMRFLGYEHWGSSETGNHSSHFLSLAGAVGLQMHDLENHQPLSQTKKFAEKRTKLCLEGPLIKALGALAFANEYSNTTIFRKYKSGVQEIMQNHGIEIPTGYFEAHIDEEPEDYILFKKMMETYLSSAPGQGARDPKLMQVLALSGANALLDARQSWYDELSECMKSRAVKASKI